MKYWLGAVAVIAVAAGSMWLFSPGKPVAAVQAAADDKQGRHQVPARAGAPQVNSQEQSELASIADEPATIAEAAPTPLHPAPLASLAEPPVGPALAPGLTPMTVMENVRTTFRNYSARFGGNPVGTNLEITRMLNGANPLNTPFLRPDDGLEINGQGELVDNWGTPYFFHQLSGIEVEIHSAGPDRRMWTKDDLVMK